MTDQGTVEGGLEEPEALEPDQGTLDLASPDDQHSIADWEAAAAAVLRKSKRMGEDDPDSSVWARLTRTTLDGIDVTPLGIQALLEDVRTSGRPTRAGAWDVRAHVAGPDSAALNEQVLVDLDGGVTSLWLQAGAADVPALLEGVLLDLAPVVLGSTEPLAAAEALVALADDAGVDLHPDTNFGADPLGDAVRSGDHAASTEDFLPTVELARKAGARAVVVDGTVVHVRSCSRLGRRDFGVNRKRVEALRGLIEARR